MKKERRMALGVSPEVTLGKAREKVLAARKLLANGVDPAVARKEATRQIMLESQNSFEVVAREWREQQKAKWVSRHAANVLKRLEADIFPALGARPVASISAQELLDVIRVIETRGTIDIAHRANQTCGQIFRYAIATGRAERDPSADLKGALTTRAKSNYSHLRASELPEFLEKLSAYNGHIHTKLALRLLMLTFVRTMELRGAEWNEIDFAKARMAHSCGKDEDA